MIFTQIFDHIDRALSKLARPFQKPKIRGLVAALVSEVQALEDAIWSVGASYRSLSATGKTLDNIGDLVGAPVRGPRNDSQYQARVAAQIKINSYDGTPANVYAVSKALVSAWNVPNQPFAYRDGTATVVIRAEPSGSIVNSDAEAQELAQVLSGSCANGVRHVVESQPQAFSASAVWDSVTAGQRWDEGNFCTNFDV